MTRLLAITAVLAGCFPAAPELPWLHGVQALELSTNAIAGKVPDDTTDPCTDEAYAQIELFDGAERITASVAQGVQVYGPAQQLLERAGGETCRVRSRHHQVVALGVGTVGRTRTILVVDEAVERDRTLTRVSLYRSGPLDHLDRVFTGLVEIREHDARRTGELSFVGERLLHALPDGGLGVWTFDARARSYVPQRVAGVPLASAH